jgi:hypothetical protein
MAKRKCLVLLTMEPSTYSVLLRHYGDCVTVVAEVSGILELCWTLTNQILLLCCGM